MGNYYISFIGDYDYSILDFNFYSKNEYMSLKICKSNLKKDDVILVYKYDDNYCDEGIYCLVKVAKKEEGHKEYSLYKCKIMEIAHDSPVIQKNHTDDLPYIDMSQFQTIIKKSKTETEMLVNMPYDISDNNHSLIVHKIEKNRVEEIYGDFNCFKKYRKTIEYRGLKAKSKEELYKKLYPKTKPTVIAKTIENTAKLYRLSWEEALNLLQDYDEDEGIWLGEILFKNKKDLYSYYFPKEKPNDVSNEIEEYIYKNKCDWYEALNYYFNKNN